MDDSHSQVAWVAAAGGLAAAGLLAVSLTFWNWATQAKFYSLHFAFVAGLLWLALRVHRAFATDGAARALPAPRWPPSAWPSAIRLLHFLVFTIGLAITNHFLTFLLVPGLVTLVFTPLKYANEIARHSLRHIGTLLVAGLLPLLLYLYLPIRASMDPLFAWGLPDTWGDFWRQVTAQTYQGLFGSGNLGTHFVDAAVYAANQFSIWLGIVLLVPLGIGMRYLWRSDRGLLAATSLTAVLSLLAALNYSIREIATYYVPLYMIALWWVGLGVAQGVQWLHNWLAPREETARRIALSVLFGALLPLLALVINWGVAGHRDNETADLFVRNAFKNFRPNAVVLTDYWDLTSASFYFQHVLGERPDVVLIDKSLLRQPFYIDYLERNYPDVVSKNAEPFQRYKVLLRQWIDTGHTPPGLTTAYLDTLNGFIDSNLGQRPIYADFVVPASDQDEQRDVDALLGQRRNQLVPDGFGYRIAPTADDRATQDPQFDLRGVTTQKVPLDEIEVSIVALYPGFLQSIGSYLANSQTTNDQQIGARLLDQAAQLQPLVAFQDERPRLR